MDCYQEGCVETVRLSFLHTFFYLECHTLHLWGETSVPEEMKITVIEKEEEL